MALQIIVSEKVPDSTYFNMSDIAPVLEGTQVTIYNGKGSRRGWGAPTVTSTVVLNTDDLTALHVGFHHKHGGNQGWHYYRGTQKMTWAQLSDAERQQVLDNKKTAPAWAKIPGQLRQQAKAAKAPQTAYKLVKLVDGKYLSFFDGTEYTLGKRLTQAAKPEHEGGYYSYPSVEGVWTLWDRKALVSEDLMEGVDSVALLEVEISGKTVTYQSGKTASTHIRPIRVVETRSLAAANV